MPQQISALLTPWFLLALVLFLLVQAEKWIHSHLYGVGWLLTNEKRSATVLYYLILAPGVFVHEVTQWLVAGALNVKTKRVMAWPEAQDNGTLRLDFVQIHPSGRIRSAIIGAVPMVTGIAIIWLISNRILDMEVFRAALSKGDMKQIGPALHDMGRASDFYLWLYLMFAVGNAMLPTPADRKGWPLILATFGGIIAFLVVIGTGDVLLETYKDTVLSGVRLVTTAFATVLGLEVCAVLVIGFIEEILERTTKRKFEYRPEQAKIVEEREPGSSMPLPPGALLPSIYNQALPIPSPAKYATLAAKAHKPSPALAGSAAAYGERLSFQRSAASPFGGPDKPIDVDEEDEDIEEKPALGPRPSTEPGFQRPASPFGAPPRKPADEKDNEEKELDKPALGPRPSTGPGFQRPASPFRAPSKPVSALLGDDTEEDDIEDKDDLDDDDLKYVDIDDV